MLLDFDDFEEPCWILMILGQLLDFDDFEADALLHFDDFEEDA